MTKTVSNRIYSTIASFITAAIILMTSGCATLFSGTTDTITFTSSADPVRVYIGGRLVGTTPLTTTVHREIGKGPLVKFEKDGYGTQEFALEKEFNWVSILDVSSVVTSGGIDALTGAIMKYSKDRYHVEMIPSTASRDDAQRQIAFARFVLLSADGIRSELATDQGEYLASLSGQAWLGEADRAKFAAWLASHRKELIAAGTPEKLLAAVRRGRPSP